MATTHRFKVTNDAAALTRAVVGAAAPDRAYAHTIAPDEAAILKDIAQQVHAEIDGGWLCPRRSPLVFVERSKGYVHLWFGAFGLHLAWPLHKTRPDFCSDWWR